MFWKETITWNKMIKFTGSNMTVTYYLRDDRDIVNRIIEHKSKDFSKGQNQHYYITEIKSSWVRVAIVALKT